MIRFDNVSKRYPDGTVAVDDLSLEAPTGKITVFVGPSGCGKTTSLRMINRMIDPTSGSIWIDDTNAADLPAHELRRKIGYVIQHAGLFPHRTIIDNIATVPYLLGQDKTKARQRAGELLERVGLPGHFAKRYPAQLSGGQQQRVGVARALAADPPVMLMDEPFSAVDPVVREQLQEQFLQLQGDLGKTIAFVTHDIDEAIKLGDQIAVMQVGGKLAQLASPSSCCPGRRTPSSPSSWAETGDTGRWGSPKAVTCPATTSPRFASEQTCRSERTARTEMSRGCSSSTTRACPTDGSISTSSPGAPSTWKRQTSTAAAPLPCRAARCVRPWTRACRRHRVAGLWWTATGSSPASRTCTRSSP